MDEYLEERIGDAETEGDALTNEVYFTDEGTVVKVYPRYPLSSIYASFVSFLDLKPAYLDRGTRLDNEVRTKEEIRDAGLRAPEVVHRCEDAIEFERVPGISGYEYLNSCSGSEARELGQKLARFLPVLHERDVALRDLRVSNLIIEDGIHLIDHEYASLDAGRFSRWVDELTLLSSVRRTKNYAPFRKGYEGETGLGTATLCLSVITSLGHAVLLERSPSRVRSIFSSVRSDLDMF